MDFPCGPEVKNHPCKAGDTGLIPSQRSEVKSLSCVRLCNPMDCSLPGSSVNEICQAIVLEWIAICFSRGSSQPRDRTLVSCIAGRLSPHFVSQYQFVSVVHQYTPRT